YPLFPCSVIVVWLFIAVIKGRLVLALRQQAEHPVVSGAEDSKLFFCVVEDRTGFQVSEPFHIALLLFSLCFIRSRSTTRCAAPCPIVQIGRASCREGAQIRVV